MASCSLITDPRESDISPTPAASHDPETSRTIASIFILPPCLKTLAQRLRTRASDDDHVIEKRLAGAREEMSHYGEFDYLVVNDNFERALYELAAIVEARRLTTDRQAVRQAATLADLLSGTETQ